MALLVGCPPPSLRTPPAPFPPALPDSPTAGGADNDVGTVRPLVLACCDS